jgi:predicted MFS family arabinose efflux permease
MSSETARRNHSAAAVVLVATLVTIYIVSQFLRSSIGVIAPNLAQELKLSPGEIGLLSSIFFFVFAAVQIPLGVLLDRFGARACLTIGAAITVVGCLAFAWAASPLAAMVGRALLGVGTAGSLVASLAVYAGRFPPARFATLTGLHVGLGTLGTLMATAPLAYGAATIGWRQSFLLVGAFTLVIGSVVFAVLRGGVQSAHSRAETLRESVIGMLAVMRAPSVGRLFAMHLIGYSSFGLIAGLWGGPYLAHIYGYGLEERGAFLLIPVVSQILGSMLWGPTDRLCGSYKIPVLTGALLTAGSLAWLAFVGKPTPLVLGLWFAIFGFVAAYFPVLIAHGKSVFAPHQVGRGLTLLNIGSMGGVFLAQAISGYVIGLFPVSADGSYELTAYRTVFALQAGSILLMSFGYFGSFDPARNARTKTAPGIA